MTDLTIYTPDECFSLAERVASSALVPQAYRNKPVDAGIAMLYGIEMGLSPMTSLQRIVVINGKPTLDAQGMVALIRQAGHSISGDITETEAVVRGKRGDTGDEMTSTFSMNDAKLAGLAGSTTYKKYPKDMLWARAVSQLGRRLFADVLMAASYGPEEMQAVVDDSAAPAKGRKPKPVEAAAVEVDDVVDAEIVDPRTGEILETLNAIETDKRKDSKVAFMGAFGAPTDIAPDKLDEAIAYARALATFGPGSVDDGRPFDEVA